MREQLVTFRTSNLAKEKGFDEYCTEGYNLKKELTTIDISSDSILGGKSVQYKNSKLPKYSIEANQRWHINNCANVTAPTQSLLQKWLREKHLYHFHIYYGRDRKWCLDIYYMDVDEDYATGLMNQPNEFMNFDTYEEALEEGLYQALKLI